MRLIQLHMEKYPSGRWGSPAKGVGRVDRRPGSNPGFSAKINETLEKSRVSSLTNPVSNNKGGVLLCREAGNSKEPRGNHPLDILDSCGQETLFAHIANSEHASKAQAMIDFRFCEGTLNRFLAAIVNAPARRRLREERNLVQGILPNMSFHHPSLHTLAKALCSSGTLRTCF